MSYVRIPFFLILCMVSCIWAGLALYAQTVRLEHFSLISSIKAGSAVAGQPALNRAMRIVPCSVPLHREAALLLTQSVDNIIVAPDAHDSSEEDAYLSKTLQVLGSLLACTPMDGKAWLDFAMVNTYREGFTPRSLEAYKMSERVSPGESWLAEKRLLFALEFRPLFDTEARAAAGNDLKTLEIAHPNHMNAVLKASQVGSLQKLYALFFTQLD